MRGSEGLSSVIYNRIVEAAVAQRLIELNKQFYQKLAAPFSASRDRLQLGVQRVLRTLPSAASVLDLGCGNGSVAKELAQRGHQGLYVGLDFSAELLAVGRQAVEKLNLQPSTFNFIQADLTSSNWSQQKVSSQPFDFAFAFAVMHHIPSRELRLQFLHQVRSLIASGGRFVHSNWQFLNSPKLRGRIQPWTDIGLNETQLDAGDYLLDWRSGGEGLRYVHQFDREELAELANAAGFVVSETFASDGKSGDLGLYSVWQLRSI